MTEIHKHKVAPSETIVSVTFKLIGVIDVRPLFIRMTSCKEVRNQLLISHGGGVLSDHELLLLCDLYRCDILDLPSDSFRVFALPEI